MKHSFQRIMALILVLLLLTITGCHTSTVQRRDPSGATSSGERAEPVRRRRSEELSDYGTVPTTRREATTARRDASVQGRSQGSTEDAERRRVQRRDPAPPQETSDPASSLAPPKRENTPGTSLTAPEDGEAPASLYNQLIAAVKRAEYPVTLSCSYDTFLDLYNQLQDDPAIFWVRGFQCSYTAMTCSIYFLYTHDTVEKIAAAQQQIDTAAEQCLRTIPADATEFEKVMRIHDWLAEQITYVSDDHWNDQTLYGALGLKECVCAGFSEAYSYLTRLVGLQSHVVIGYANSEPSALPDTINHAWNAIYLEDDWYYVDVTWDNVDKPCKDGIDHPFYTWALLTYEDMIPSHKPQDPADMPASTSDALHYHLRVDHYLDSFSLSELNAKARQTDTSSGFLSLRFSSEQVFQEAYGSISQWCTEGVAYVTESGSVYVLNICA